MHGVGVWQETRAPGVNPHGHREDAQNSVQPASVVRIEPGAEKQQLYRCATAELLSILVHLFLVSCCCYSTVQPQAWTPIQMAINVPRTRLETTRTEIGHGNSDSHPEVETFKVSTGRICWERDLNRGSGYPKY